MDSIYFKAENRNERIQQRAALFNVFHPSLQSIQNLNYRFLTGSSGATKNLQLDHALPLALLLALFDSDYNSVYVLASYMSSNQTTSMCESNFKWFAYTRAVLVDDGKIFRAVRKAFGEEYHISERQIVERDFLDHWILKDDQPWQFTSDFQLPSLFWMIPDKKSTFIDKIVYTNGSLPFLRRPLYESIQDGFAAALEADEQEQWIQNLQKYYKNPWILGMLCDSSNIVRIFQGGHLTKMLDMLLLLVPSEQPQKKEIGKVLSFGVELKNPVIIKCLVNYCRTKQIEFNWKESKIIDQILNSRSVALLSCIEEFKLSKLDKQKMLDSILGLSLRFTVSVEFIKAIVDLVGLNWKNVYIGIAKAICRYTLHYSEEKVQYLLEQKKFPVANSTIEQWIQAHKSYQEWIQACKSNDQRCYSYSEYRHSSTDLIRLFGLVQQTQACDDPRPLYKLCIHLLTSEDFVKQSSVVNYDSVPESNRSKILYTGLSIAICYITHLVQLVFPADLNSMIDLPVIAEHFKIKKYSNLAEIYIQVFQQTRCKDPRISVQAMEVILRQLDLNDELASLQLQAKIISWHHERYNKAIFSDNSNLKLVTDRSGSGKHFCKICQAGDADSKVQLPCGRNHKVHLDCMFHWMKNYTKCPVCDTKIMELKSMHDEHRNSRQDYY